MASTCSRLAAAAACLAAIALFLLRPPVRADPLSPGGGDWPQYRHDNHSTWMNPGVFDKAQATTVQPLWTFEMGVAGYGAPTLVGNTVYIAAAFHSGKVYALDANTGALHWQRQFLGTLTTTGCGIFTPGIWHAPAVIDGVLYIGAPDGKVYALDAATGATQWSAQTAAPSPHGEFLAAAPVVSPRLGKLYIGGSAITDCDLPPGKIYSVDLATHAVQSQTVLAPGRVGGTIWSSITVEQDAGVVYATTGNPAHNPSVDPYSQSFVAFDALSLQKLDHWQDPTYTSFEDSDFGASPTLFRAADGTPMVTAPNKDGWLFALRRGDLSDGPVWKRSLAINGGPDKGRGSIVAPTFANGTLYAAGGETPAGEPGTVLALDPGTGRLLWKHVPPGYVIAGMPAVGDVLVVPVTASDNSSHTLEILEASSGAVLAQYAGPHALWAAPTVGHGLIIFTDTVGHVTALQIPAYRTGGSNDGGTPGDGGTDGGTDGGIDGGRDGGGSDGGGTGPAVAFSGNFSRLGPLGASWAIAQGGFTDDGAHAQPTAPHAYAVALASSPLSATVKATVGILGIDYNGVLLRANTASPASAHYAAYLNRDGSLWVARRNASVYTYLGRATAKVDPTVPHRLALSAAGTASVLLTLSVDGAPVLSLTDTSAQRLVDAGRAGIFSFIGRGAALDDFELDPP